MIFGSAIYGVGIYAAGKRDPFVFEGWDEICPTSAVWMSNSKVVTAWPEIAITASAWTETAKDTNVTRRCIK